MYQYVIFAIVIFANFFYSQNFANKNRQPQKIVTQYFYIHTQIEVSKSYYFSGKMKYSMVIKEGYISLVKEEA